jgi:hypothetical protein
LEEGEGEALAGVAVGGLGEVDFGEALEFGDGGIAFEDLAEEELGGDLRAEATLAEGDLEIAAEGGDEGPVEEARGIAFEVEESLRDTEHGGLQAVKESLQPHHGRRPPRFPGQQNVKA